jgi:hypothetical protein
MSRGEIEISPTVQFVRVEGDFVLMDLAAGIYFGLDEVASHIWESLSDHGDAALAAEELCRDYDVSPERARADIDRWVSDLEAKGLVRRRPGASPDASPGATPEAPPTAPASHPASKE